MKNYLIAAAVAASMPAVAISQNAPFQPATDIGTSIPIAIRVPPAMPGVDQAMTIQLEARLSRILTGTGLAAVPGGADFVMFPNVIVLEERVVEGSRQMTVVKIDVSLYIKSVFDGVLFASTSKILGGAGRTRNAALINAVSSLQGNDPGILAFFQTARDRILDYYSQRCDQIILEAKTAAELGNVDQALGSLLGIPDVVSDCKETASKAAVAIYAVFERDQCENALLMVRSAVAAENFEEAIENMSSINPGGACSDEADAVIDEIAQAVSVRADREAREVQTKLEEEMVRRASIKSQIETEEGAREWQESLMEVRAKSFFAKWPPPAFKPGIFGI